MLKLKSSVCALALAVGLGGCAQTTYWMPGPHQDASNFGQVNGQCKMVAMGADSGGGFAYAQGSPQFVGTYLGAVTVASAIGSAVRQQNAYSACMEAQGFVESASPDVRRGQAAQVLQQGRACVQTIKDKPVYASLLPHYRDPQTGYSPAQLADTNTPTPAEAQLLSQYINEALACADQTIAGLTQIAPTVGPILAQQKADVQAINAQLINRQMTWGAYAQRVKQITDSTAAKINSMRV
jgi:hypothetical protein